MKKKMAMLIWRLFWNTTTKNSWDILTGMSANRFKNNLNNMEDISETVLNTTSITTRLQMSQPSINSTNLLTPIKLLHNRLESSSILTRRHLSSIILRILQSNGAVDHHLSDKRHIPRTPKTTLIKMWVDSIIQEQIMLLSKSTLQHRKDNYSNELQIKN